MAHYAHAGKLPDWPGQNSPLMTFADLDVVAAAVAEMAQGWSADLNQTSSTESTIVVMPESANDLLGPAFVLHRGEGRVHLDQFRWDEYRKLGAFATLEDALYAMRERLLPLVARRSRPPRAHSAMGEGGVL